VTRPLGSVRVALVDHDLGVFEDERGDFSGRSQLPYI
jgi:hypothetical protein